MTPQRTYKGFLEQDDIAGIFAVNNGKIMLSSWETAEYGKVKEASGKT